MTDYSRPENLPAWAESGDTVQPSDAEIQEGWPVTNVPPARQRFNWILNWLANAVRYLTQIGVPEWNSGETYRQFSRVTHNGLTYRAKQAGTNKNPISQTAYWERWGYASSEILPRVDSVLSKSVAGGTDVTLTDAEADNGVLVFTGVLTGNINVVVPNTGRRWAVYNGTSGSYTLSLKTSSGSAIEVKQGKSVTAYCDGANAVRFAGADNTVFFTATEFPYSASTTVSVTYTVGAVLVFLNGAELLAGDFTATNGTSITVPSFTTGDTLKVVAFQSFTIANTYTKAEAVAFADFTGSNQSIGTSGYQKLPGGLIMQWGVVNAAGLAEGSDQAVTFPLAFPNAVFHVGPSVNNSTGGTTGTDSWTAHTRTTSGFDLRFESSSTGETAPSPCYVTWFAVGN